MAARGPITLSLPAFRGAVRQLVLLLVVLFFVLAVLDFAVPSVGAVVGALLWLQPVGVVGHFYLWQLLTYAFLNTGILSTAFVLLTLWFTGAMLEEARGPRWFVELFYVSTVGGALLATLLAALPLATGGHVRFLAIDPHAAAAGVAGPLFGVLVAFAVLFGDVEFLLFFLIRLKAKYMVILSVLLYVATLLRARDTFGALLALCCGLTGFLYARLSHRNGLRVVASERFYGVRNNYFRWKRRRAARQFEVYMRKQDRVVKFDEEGRYIAPDDERRDPNSRKWMN